MRAGALPASLAAALVLAAGCGGDEAALVPAERADAIFAALRAGQPVLGRCADVREPAAPESLRLYGLLAATTREAPERLLQSADFVDRRTPMAEYARGFLDRLAACLARTARPGAGWTEAERRLRSAVGG